MAENQLSNEDKKPFSMTGDDISHLSMYFEELQSIIEYISNNDQCFTLKGLQLELFKMLSDWPLDSIEQNLYFLQSIKLIKLEVVDETPIRKYQAFVESKALNHATRFADPKFSLDKRLTISEIEELISEIQKETSSHDYKEFKKEIQAKFINSIPKNKQRKALKKESERRRKGYFSETNTHALYRVDRPDKLAQSLFEIGTRKELPDIKMYTWFASLMKPLQKLRFGLELRFHEWNKLNIVNEILDNLSISTPEEKIETEIAKEEPPPLKIKAKAIAIAYILDCIVEGTFNKIPFGSRGKLEEIGNKRRPQESNYSSSTFYNYLNKFNDNPETSFISPNFLNRELGDDWRKQILQASHQRESLDKYLKSKLL